MALAAECSAVVEDECSIILTSRLFGKISPPRSRTFRISNPCNGPRSITHMPPETPMSGGAEMVTEQTPFCDPSWGPKNGCRNMAISSVFCAISSSSGPRSSLRRGYIACRVSAIAAPDWPLISEPRVSLKFSRPGSVGALSKRTGRYLARRVGWVSNWSAKTVPAIALPMISTGDLWSVVVVAAKSCSGLLLLLLLFAIGFGGL